jgi:pyruvate ferredoxin oxidoreductase alpha subunit
VGDYSVPHALDTSRPTTQGPFAMPDYYFELRRQQAHALELALDAFTEVAAEYEELSGRDCGLLEAYRLDGAERAIVALGSSAGTIKDVVDDLRAEGEPVGMLKIVSFRPFPAQRVAALLGEVSSVIVLDRADSPGGAAPLHAEVAAALYGSGINLRGHVYGLGGRDLHPEDIAEIFAGRASRYVGLRGEPCPV